MAILTKQQWLKRKRRKRRILRALRTLIFLFLLIPVILLFLTTKEHLRVYKPSNIISSLDTKGLITIDKMLLTPNIYSRPETSLYEIKSIVIHYTGNPGTTGIANRNYFENLKITQTTYASSHYVIGLEGELIQCIPLNEVAYASNGRNNDTISIEACHPSTDGKFTRETYDSLVALVALLTHQYDLGREDIIRHYDVTGKKCPLYFVEHEEEWEGFKDDVMDYINDNSL